MINKLNKKHKIILIVIGILIITSITIGISYAYWQLTHKQTGNNELATGCFEVIFEETGSDIVLTNTFPIIDEEGLQQVPYKFKIKNTCTIDAQYNITLNSFGATNLMADSSIKYAFGLSKKDKLTYDKKILTTAIENTNISNIDLNNLIKSYIIGNGFLRVGEEKEFSLYLWMDQDAPMSEMKKTFSAKIYVTNVTTNKAPLLANLKATSSIASTGTFLNGPLSKDRIEKLEFVNSNNVPNDALRFWDVSEQQNGAIMAWLYDKDANGLYEVYIGQEGGVVANPNSSYLFQFLINLSSIDLTNFDTSNVTTMSDMFNNCRSLTSLDVSGFDTSKVTTMYRMFSSLQSLTNLNVSSFDTSNVTDMSGMFSGAWALMSLDLSNFNTSNVTNMSSMFDTCSSLTSLNISNFETSKVTSMSYMFNNCRSLTSLDLSSFDTAKVTQIYNMFYYCSKLTSINLVNAVFNNPAVDYTFFGVPLTAIIRVKDLAAQNFILSYGVFPGANVVIG